MFFPGVDDEIHEVEKIILLQCEQLLRKHLRQVCTAWQGLSIFYKIASSTGIL